MIAVAQCVVCSVCGASALLTAQVAAADGFVGSHPVVRGEVQRWVLPPKWIDLGSNQHVCATTDVAHLAAVNAAPPDPVPGSVPQT